MVCSSCSNRSGSMRCSRCKIMFYCNRECQAAHWSTHRNHCKKVQMSPQKLQLHFTAGPTVPPITFHEDIPAPFCQRDGPRDLTNQWLGQLVDSLEEKVLARYSGLPCVYCGKQAIRLHTTLTISLYENPPTVWCGGPPLCTKDRNDGCAIQARAEIEKVLQSPNFPPDAEIYQA
ncbi:hypothetical protein B0H16DRAFT_1516670 [Mycena metata]|uniref:MYND-type domain-containing protein n=1 Tax=Mycena metata TaxID=1033252 RepID=A0AAD7JSY8_9AGAR|nr:hypothetical protein B0H16DRAFT_1516670 [Mycena metata]